MKERGLEPWIGDLTDPGFERPGGHFDAVIYSAAAGREDGPAAYRMIYVEAQQRLLASFAADRPTRWVYTGSTGVYGQSDGSLVKESSPTEPGTETGAVLVQAERMLLEAAQGGFPSVILRIAGIYGPGRLHLLHAFVANQVRIGGKGQRHLNMVHRDDVVGAVLAALRNGRAGEVYNVVDGEPVTEIHFYTWLSETLGKWVPPFGPTETDPARARGLADRRISNRRLTMELGCRLKYPSFRQGYTAEIKALTDAGLLEIEPEKR